MKRLALVMGRQGSGKTTRVCAELKRRFQLRLHWQTVLPFYFRMNIRENYYNHIALDHADRPFFVTGVSRDRVTHSIDDALQGRLNVLELPHSGYAPSGINVHFNNQQLCTHAFVIMLPENTWRGYDQEVGQITSPDYFMQHVPLKVARSKINYARDCEKIRAEINDSGIPYTCHAAADEMIEAVSKFLVGTGASLPSADR